MQHLDIVQLECAPLDVHGHKTRDISLEGQQQEGDVVYEQEEFVLLDGVIEQQFPVQLIILQPYGEKTGMS